MYNNLLKMRIFMMAFLLVALGLMVYAQNEEPKTIEGVIRVKLEPELVQASPQGIDVYMQKGVALSGINQIDKLNTDYAAYEMKRVFRYSPKFEAKHREYGLHLWYEIRFKDAANSKMVAQSYAGISGVMIAEPIYNIELKDGSGDAVVAPMSESRTDNYPYDDPYLPDQWHYNNIGQTDGTIGADINLFEAWETTSGSSDIIVSVHDEGIDISHDDLKDNIWINEAELKGEEGVDDDGNGYRDDIYGFNFAANAGNIDPMNHGTHVGGTVAATNNNGIGLSGVAGGSGNNDGVKLMACQILGNYGGSDLTPESFVYAADMGAVISQNSWGYVSAGYYNQAVHDAVDYFVAEAGNNLINGGLVFFASGNSYAEDYLYYPGAYENVIGVAALDHNNVRATYANLGNWVDISAPGGLSDHGYKATVFSTLPGNAYGYMDGTSMACPHVTGIAALSLAANGGVGFSNDDLKRILLTSVNDIYSVEGNQDFEGKMGTGAINAALAVRSDQGYAPDAINDLSLNGIAQDFASISWSVPADMDDDIPVEFEVYWSTEAITLGTLEIAKKVVLKNSYDAGTSMDYEIAGLRALTPYYFTVRSIDRWGNISDFSNIVTDTTNEGPDASVDETALTINIDVSADPMGTDTFNILNSGEGILKWTAVPRHKNNYDAWSNSLNYPALNKVKTDDQIRLTSTQVPQNEKVSPMAQENISEYMGYWDPWYPLYIIGETDLSLTNSSATRFTVNSEEGFNLNMVETYLQHDPVTGPIIMEIYEGDDINNSRLIYAKEENSWSDMGYWRSIRMDEQIFFENGESFWIVFHIPSNNLYPLAIGMETAERYSDNCYMSFNLGKSWVSLEDAFLDNRAVWAVTAVSTLKALDTYITLTPDNGDLPSNLTEQVVASVNATELIEGTYNANIVINTNDFNNEMIRIPLTLNVTGQVPNLIVPEMVDFGSVVYGLEKELDIELVNTGLDKFRNPSVTISNPDFTHEGWLSSINAKGENVMTIKYNPSSPGTSNALVTLSSSDGHEVQFVIVGVASEPPVAMVNPNDTLITGLAIGDTVYGNFRIKNTGSYPLKYYIPAYSEENFILNDPMIHKYGYTFEVNPALYDWTDISSIGTDVTGYFDGVQEFKQVPLDFEFPFFGIEEDSVYLTRYGLVSFDPNSSFNVDPISFKDHYSPDRFISAWATKFAMAEGGKIFCKSLNDKFIIQWEGVPKVYYNRVTWTLEYAFVTFQIVLFDNGNIAMYYKDIATTPASELSRAFVAIEDQNQDDGLLCTDAWNPNYPLENGMAVLFTNPGLGIFSTVDNTEGTVLSGDSVTVNYMVETEKLWQDSFTERLAIVTNDPFNNPAFHTVNLEITSGGVSDVSLDTDTLDFGQVFQNGVKKMPFMIMNDGTLNVVIDTMRFKYDNYTIEWGEDSTDLKARHKLTYELGIESGALGTVYDTLTIETSEGQLLTITLMGEIIEAPQISTDITVIDETMPAGDSTLLQVTVTNNGGNNLEFYSEGNEWLYMMEDGTGTGFDYTVINSKKDDGPNYNWIDITETGNRDTLKGYTQDPDEFFSTVVLPEPFIFYGIAYDTMYIGANGFVTFTKEFNFDELFWGARHPFPNEVNPNNFIAPLWFFGGQDWVEASPKAGVYHEFFNDKTVVTWQDHITNFGMGLPVSFQTILFNDGRIKFQYNMGSADQSSPFGSAGIENVDGTKGIGLYFRSVYIEDKMAVMFSPANTYTVAPSESKTFDILVDGREMFGGSYTGELQLHNNVPGSEDYAIPATLTLSGDPEATLPTVVDLGEIVAVEQPNNWMEPWKTYELEFELKNTGKAVLDINSMSVNNLSGETFVKEWYQASGWWGPMWGWYNVDDTWNVKYPQSVDPSGSLKFKAVIAPTGANLTICDTLTINCGGVVGTIKVAVEADVILPPTLNVSVEEISVIAPKETFTKDSIIVIDNIGGKSALNYQLRLDFGRAEQSAATANNVVTNYSSAPAIKSVEYNPANQNAEMETYSIPGYNRTLEHDTASTPNGGFLGYGGQWAFTAATKFMAPSDGFNLTHVMTWFRNETWENSSVKVEIRSGADDPNNSIVLATQVFDYATTGNDEEGIYHTIELDENIVFFPNEAFYVAFYYPIGVSYPQGITGISETVSNRYYFGPGDMFYDLANSGVENAAFMHKALEFEAQSGVWTEITSAMSGTLSVDEVDTIEVHFDAMYAELGLNTADLVIESNDPENPEAKVVLNLIRNRGPQFEDAPELILEAQEGVTSAYTVNATDLEADEFTFSMPTSVEKMTATQNGDAYELTYSPDHDAEASYTFEIVATDTNNNVSILPVTILVENVNRAPIVSNAMGTKYLYTSVGIDQHATSEIFTDPDGDVLTVTAQIEDDAIVDVPISNTTQTIVFMPVDLGQSQVVLTAMDAEGASVNDTVMVIVGEASGITDRSASMVELYPNPTSDFVNINLANVNFNIELVRIIDAKGAVVYEVIPEDKDLRLDLQTMAKGAYYLEIIGSGDSYRELIIKH